MTMIEQGTEAWKQQRIGCVTASRVADVVARTKTGWGASRANYMADLIVERLTGKPTEGYTSPAMQWGIEHEAEARAAYEFMQDCEVEPAGFVLHPTIGLTGASPDGFVGPDGLIEIKCPNSATHIDTLLGKTIDGKYITQMQWQMACTKRAWCDWVSFDPRLPGSMRLHFERVPRDDAMIQTLEREVVAFLAELRERMDRLIVTYQPGEPITPLLMAG